MTGDQGWGVVLIVVGIFTISFRRLFYVGSEEHVYREENNLANPGRKPTSAEDQRIVLIGGVLFVIVGILAILGLPPFA